MLWVPKKGVLRKEDNLGSVGSATPGTSVTTGAASGTKGTTTQLIASTSFDAYWLRVTANSVGLSATGSDCALDILIGAATEDLLIPNLLAGGAGGDTGSNFAGWKVWDFPLYIPAGSRLSAAAASLRLSAAIRVGVQLIGGDGYPPWRVGSKVTTYGMGTVPNGTAITPGASGAEGTFTQLTAATSEDHFAFVPSFQCTNDTTMNNRYLQVDLGIGAATEEQIGTWWFGTNAAEAVAGPFDSMPAYQDVPSGTRLAMRASNSGVNDAGYDGVVHAVSA
jgi:hypothetical protein